MHRAAFPETEGVQDAIKGLKKLRIDEDFIEKNLWAAIDELGEDATAEELLNSALRISRNPKSGASATSNKDVAKQDSVERAIRLADELAAILEEHPLAVRLLSHVAPIVTWHDNLQTTLKGPINQVKGAQADGGVGGKQDAAANVTSLPVDPTEQAA
ncbi:MAG: hypothetical protein AB9869_33165 [Verrucomicrobiia bacterium]